MGAGPAYDTIGLGYARTRKPDPTISAMVMRALGPAPSVVSVGAGSGSYEPLDRWVVAVEPSSVMIAQRPAASAPAVQAVGQSLPFSSASFDAALAILTVHHWPDLDAGLSEMRRVARRQIVLTFDPVLHCRHWLIDYVPEIEAIFRAAPTVEVVADRLHAVYILPVPVAHDTPDGMTIAYWRRPEAYLDGRRRAGSSALQQVDEAALRRGLRQLELDLKSGAWVARYGYLLAEETMDYGLRLIVS
jgi:SAM-dependent methyltransferase